MNQLVAATLRSRIHRLFSGAVLLLSYAGRRTGRRVTFPVQYAAHGREVVIVPAHSDRKQWWRNLLEPRTVEVTLRGTCRRGVATAMPSDTPAGRSALAAYTRRFPSAQRAVALGHARVVVRVELDTGLRGCAHGQK